MSIDEQELQEWVKSLRNVIASSGFGEISDEGIYWIIYEYGKLLKNKPSGLEIESKEPEPYDAGLLNDFGGGNVSWWHDYIRSELERAHDHYTQQFIAPTRITEQDAREIFNSIWEDQEPQFDYWIENCGGRELLNKLNEDRQVSDDAPAQKLWDYYQNLLRHYGFDGITDLLVKYRKLAEQVPTVAVSDDEECDDPHPLNTLENFLDEWGITGQIEKQLVTKAWYRAIESVSPQPLPDDKPKVVVSEIIKAVADFVGSQKGGPFAPEVIKAAIIGQLEYGDEFTKLFSLTANKQDMMRYDAGFKDGTNAGYKLAKQDFKKKMDDLKKDALRYRWLRDGNNEKNSEAMNIAVNHYGDEWDEMIDAAMQEPSHDN